MISCLKYLEAVIANVCQKWSFFCFYIKKKLFLWWSLCYQAWNNSSRRCDTLVRMLQHHRRCCCVGVCRYLRAELLEGAWWSMRTFHMWRYYVSQWNLLLIWKNASFGFFFSAVVLLGYCEKGFVARESIS